MSLILKVVALMLKSRSNMMVRHCLANGSLNINKQNSIEIKVS